MGQLAAARAYDALAARYDRETRGDEWMRAILHRHYLRVFRPGQHILDVGCGSGTDAIVLARRGVRVTGIDVSAAMIAELRRKATDAGVAALIEGCVLDATALDELAPARFDGVISSFAALSTVPDLASFAASAARLLPPRGRMVLHLLGRFSLWEAFGLLRGGQLGAVRHLATSEEREFTIGGQAVTHHLFHPRQAYRWFFAPHFRLHEAYSLGSLRPPHTVRRVPAPLVELLGTSEGWLSHWPPLLDCGRFYVLDLERRP